MGKKVGTLASIVHTFRNRELLRSVREKHTIEKVAKMNWKDFEMLIGEYFKTQGFDVTPVGGSRPDGGIDIELHKDGELYLVQCKHYRSWKVPVHTVRDLYGAMAAHGASGGFVVTSGRFTGPAKRFAQGRFITLIDGKHLADILQQVELQTPIKQTDTGVSPRCPKCGSVMVRRVAHRGTHAGHSFWGCSRYPRCRGVIEIL